MVSYLYFFNPCISFNENGKYLSHSIDFCIVINLKFKESDGVIARIIFTIRKKTEIQKQPGS